MMDIKKMLESTLNYFADVYYDTEFVEHKDGLNNLNRVIINDNHKINQFSLGYDVKKSDSRFLLSINSGNSKPYVMSHGTFNTSYSLLIDIKVAAKKTDIYEHNTSIIFAMESIIPDYFKYLTELTTITDVSYSWITNASTVAASESGLLNIQYKINITMY